LETVSRQPLWPYTWGRIFHSDLPVRLAYRYGVTRTVVLGGGLPPRVIIAGASRLADLPQCARGCGGRRPGSWPTTVVAAQAVALARSACSPRSRLAFGIYPLRQFSDRTRACAGW
jgi:hypothetical protein